MSPFNWRNAPSIFMADNHFCHGRHGDKVAATKNGVAILPADRNQSINTDTRRPADKSRALRKGTI